MSPFTSSLVVTPLSDGRTWVVRKAFGFDLQHERGSCRVLVPPGFQTDFASMPRLLWAILPMWGKYGYASVIHDWMYWDQSLPRATADEAFLCGMTAFRVWAPLRWAIYVAVRLFGWLTWNRNKMERATGVDRVLREPPTEILARRMGMAPGPADADASVHRSRQA